MVYPEVEARDSDAPYKTPSILFRNLGGGKFEELPDLAGPAMKELHSSRGAAFGDFDNDGDMDVLVILEIRWPSGKEERVADVAADQLVVIREGSGIIRKESFDRRPARK